MAIQFQSSLQKPKVKGIGGIFILKRKDKSYVTSDVKSIIPTSAKEAKEISETINKKIIDSNTNFNNEVLISNTLNNDMTKSELKRKPSPNAPKLPKKKTKITAMNVFRSNYFNN